MQTQNDFSTSYLDVAMAGSWIISAIGPIAHGGVKRVGSVLAGMATAGPAGRIGLVPDRSTRQWHYDPSRLEKAVFEIEPVTDVSQVAPTIGRLAEVARTEHRELPIWVAIAGDWLFIYLDHGIGDGWMTLGLTASILSGEPNEVAPWQKLALTPHPLRTALLTVLKQNPLLPLQSVRDMAKNRNRPGPAGPGRSTPWAPDNGAAYSYGTTESFNEMMTWRDKHLPGVSSAALHIAAKVRALREVGLEPDNTINLLVDGRRYLPRDGLVTSNFAAGAGLALEDAGNPEEVAAMVVHATRRGRAATTLLATSARLARAKNRGGPGVEDADSVPVPAQPRLAFTDMGRTRAIEPLGWLDQSRVDTHYVACVSPAGPEFITFAGGRVFGQVNDTASFHRNVFDQKLVAQALQLAVTEPVRLLSSPELSASRRNTRHL